MMKIKNKITIILFLVVLIVLAVILVFMRQGYKIERTYPFSEEDQVKVSQKITLIFNRNIPSGQWIIIPNPNFEYSINASYRNLEIIPKTDLKFKTYYKIEIRNSRIPNFFYILSFTTEDVAQNIPITNITPLPTFTYFSEEVTRKFYDDLEKKTYRDLPLFDYIPYKTENYSVDYVKPLVLKVIVRSDTKEIRQEVYDWITSKGVNPKTHTIQWVVNPNY